MEITRKITICGLVQGIGFRPFIHQVATRFHLKGEVCNNDMGVQVLVSGSSGAIHDFYNELLQYPYQLARIRSFKIEPVAHESFDRFQIVPTPPGQVVNLPFTPDLALCDRCAAELNDPSDPRYGYPFTACVSCGQRWAISYEYPFEREHTSHKKKPMCASCLEEYSSCDNRRYHAQTISCPDCGFQTWMETHGDNPGVISEDGFTEAARMLKEGKILAVKNSAGFLLCCDASNTGVVMELRHRKKRPGKPFAVLFPDLEAVRELVYSCPEEEEELTGRVSPIVVMNLKPKATSALALEALVPGLDQLGVMLPYNGILKMLTTAFGAPMVATSGNMHSRPVIADNEVALKELYEVADAFLLNDQNIANPQDDSVVRFSPGYKQRIVFRRSRGLAPNYFDAPYNTEKTLLAVGGELKSTIALIPNSYLYISQYLGALGEIETFERFSGVLDRFRTMFSLEPDLVIADKHPGYQSTMKAREIARESKAALHLVQHHKAHFAAVLAENNLFDLEDAVMGVIWDGTGYGDDGQVWGGEFFLYKNHEITRVGHMPYFPWIAGDRMAEQPRISLLALADTPELQQVVKQKFTEQEWRVYQKLKDKNSLHTASVGRLFDAAACLLDICDHNSFEGQAAMLLENLAAKAPFHSANGWEDVISRGTLDPRVLLNRLFREQQQGAAPEVLALGFLKTLVKLIFRKAEILGVTRLAFSGGVFQNALLTDLLREEAKGSFILYFHRELSPNDENIAFGQLMYTLNCNTVNK